ncbi:hypothetical protein JTE90_014030, partial [Oedothorax gibbosus]
MQRKNGEYVVTSKERQFLDEMTRPVFKQYANEVNVVIKYVMFT